MDGRHPYLCHIPNDIWERLEALKATNGDSIQQQIVRALVVATASGTGAQPVNLVMRISGCTASGFHNLVAHLQEAL